MGQKCLCFNFVSVRCLTLSVMLFLCCHLSVELQAWEVLNQIEKGKSKKLKKISIKRQAKKKQPAVVDTVQCEKCDVNSLHFFFLQEIITGLYGLSRSVQKTFYILMCLYEFERCDLRRGYYCWFYIINVSLRLFLQNTCTVF